MRGDGVRYQGALVRQGRLLLIEYKPRRGDPFWLFPGGGRQDESPEECVAREMLEETGLRVEVVQRLLDEPARGDRLYRAWRTYLCRGEDGEARPGSEPGDEHLGTIRAVDWFDLADVRSWHSALRGDPITYPQAMKLRALLGYA